MDFVFKNEFEYDWCVSACESVKSSLKDLAGSRWLVCGLQNDDFYDLPIRFLRYADLKYRLDFSFTVIVDEAELDCARDRFPYALVRSFGDVQEPIEAEYCVFCGYGRRSIACRDEQEYRCAADRAAGYFRDIARAARRSICISSTQIYDEYPYPFFAAEGEFLKDASCPNRRFYRELERLAEQTQREYVIIRPCEVLAAGENLESGTSEFLDALILNGDKSQAIARREYSVVYITDFLTAFVLSAKAFAPQEVYNVSAADTTASMMGLCDLLSRIHPDCMLKLNLTSEQPCSNRAVCGDKIRMQGWKPSVDLKTMLTLHLHGRREEKGIIWFEDGHQGKLTAIQQELLRILCQIDRICKAHNIRYFLAGGTLLGAVRHQGFIPWDDDLDVMMLRKDYDKFMSVVGQELSEEFFLQTPTTDPGSHYLISKIRLNDTVFSSEFLTRFPELHKGLFVDVIAQDYTANTAFWQKMHLKLSLLARGLVFKKWSGTSAAEINRAYAVFDVVKRLLPVSVLEKFQNFVLTMFNKKPGRQYLYDSMGINISKGVYPAQLLSDSVDIDFEGRKFPVPVGYEEYLRYLYGDYMTMPPITQRRNVHPVAMLDLGPFLREP